MVNIQERIRFDQMSSLHLSTDNQSRCCIVLAYIFPLFFSDPFDMLRSPYPRCSEPDYTSQKRQYWGNSNCPPTHTQDECGFFTKLVLIPSHTHFPKECRGCQLHCRLSPDNLLTSRILECQPGCLHNCCLCQSPCEKCHQENEVRKQSCSMLLMEVTTTESITCFQDSFENIFSS